MPCEYDDCGESERELKKELDLATRLLCTLCKLVENGGYTGFIKNSGQELVDWWAKHKKMDRKREAREKEELQENHDRNEALRKLSTKERKLLGL